MARKRYGWVIPTQGGSYMLIRIIQAGDASTVQGCASSVVGKGWFVRPQHATVFPSLRAALAAPKHRWEHQYGAPIRIDRAALAPERERLKRPDALVKAAREVLCGPEEG